MTYKKSRTMTNKAAQSLGRKGGKARLKKMTKEQRSAIARKAAQAMWEKRRKYEQEIKKATKKS